MQYFLCNCPLLLLTNIKFNEESLRECIQSYSTLSSCMLTTPFQSLYRFGHNGFVGFCRRIVGIMKCKSLRIGPGHNHYKQWLIEYTDLVLALFLIMQICNSQCLQQVIYSHMQYSAILNLPGLDCLDLWAVGDVLETKLLQEPVWSVQVIFYLYRLIFIQALQYWT